MSNLTKRSIWGLIYVVVMMGGLLFHPIAFAVVFGTLLFFTQYEFYALVEAAGHKISRLPGTLMGVFYFLICAGIANSLLPKSLLLICIPIILLMFIIELFRRNHNTLERSGLTVLGFIYIAIPFALMNFIVNSSLNGQTNVYYPWIMAGVFLILWTNDSFAYLIGTRFGKHKMCTRISPAKSWEGLIGGAVFAIVMGIVNAVLFQAVDMLSWIVIAVLTVGFGTLGDLFESKIKREIGTKDSGNILPGHGGFLDRLDSLLFAIPVVFIWLMLSGKF
ncbi:phosphatidate cytidylyltransferase [Maribellus sp. CM-23]|uniref:phosphatidate cytidylyltransferase n=1 Tax=Maribellus sp. CM-23 TaxID=2781026 RepID=UPI001F4420F8|nr:phosphatidate cytidylyltransferase [Maribellus sp. CM-23]MCE4563616.1 phosphatidate cytidylyltransferase [Maribellus sp. CM-23]